MKTAALTSQDNYFEDFEVGRLLRHARGKTVTEMDNVLITQMVMNTAEGHFNEHAMSQGGHGIFAQRVVFGGINLALVLGLAAQDTAEQCLCELRLDKIRLSHPVFHGDTLYAYSEVLERSDSDQPDAGIVRFKHYGLNQDGKLCVEAERSVLLKRKSHWGHR
ncbi:MaoC family dehydratase [Verminephrobacter eiseniae]|uniref:MaoC domain protein dehydratase n=1 Tax=Verminephrobacter eiseniae (strain EF01-2) TaxID=391735 RepID=A1WI84_VEREI|nr:MaoC family dehydratase [Verminephrobacter eiseniae]ABM57341.1 MaoC domain protein dehydratase [Verminephrobacter eiseniae EF01-2]MCW5282969.1 MaoC family dehydratase [Verminephrobacter eiseniae]MCW5303284.1 MaoC family dehydratase [Verminephrobacter eiseniae]MCW8178129.1 MaoC family dehydratase [Verminephrobacter eiseniae]MCW8188677.1 MaoC family dehydratase [Verminephrobacter eiseniae]